MRIKVDNEYLDFNDTIEVEKQARLFQDVSGVFGDYSYSFSIPKTNRNVSILGLKSINERLNFKQKKDCILYSDSGEELYGGFLKIESIGDTIEASFFSGNNSWLEATRKRLREYNFKRLQKDFNSTNLVASWSLSNGIVWPLVDRGTLYKRNTPTMVDNDWQPFIYIKDAVNIILAQSGGIKLEGELLRDPLYTSLITTNGGLAAIESILNGESAYIGKSSSQAISSTTYATITFTDTDDPFDTSEHWNTSTSTFTLPSDWITGSVEFNLKLSGTLPWPKIQVLLNGSSVYEEAFLNQKSVNETVTINNASAGDTIVIQAKKANSLSTFNYTILADSYIKIKPIKLRRVYPQQLLPDIDANEFISNVFTMFNVLPVYNYKTKVINTRLLENVKKATPIDISAYISKVTNNDFSELIADYAKASRFLYGEASDDFTEQYNSLNPDLFYGGGSIVIQNDFLEDSSDFVELDFFAPFQVPVPWLGFRLPLLEMNELAIGASVDYTKVNNSSDYARFLWQSPLSTNPFSVGSLVKITDRGGVDEYSGIYRVTAKGQQGLNAYIETDRVLYSSSSSGTLELISITDIINEDQITICNVPSTPLSDFTPVEGIHWNGSDRTTFALGYFWLPQVKKPINRIKNSLTFGRVSDPDYYQRGLLETYYPVTNQVLNDPVMVTVEAYLPETVFRDIDFLRPVRVAVPEFTGLFLVNKITGYNGVHLSCEMELVKISNFELTSETTGVIPEAAPPAADPPADPTYVYAATLYECDGCALYLSTVAVTSTIVLTTGKFYQVVHITGGTSYMAEITGTSVAGKVPVYELEYTTQYDVCSTCIEA